MLICGIDEARRGPVIGPMAICGVLVREEKLPELKKIGVKDSKLLTPEKREKLAREIKEIISSYKIVIIPPQEIDDAISSKELNLNKLEAVKTALIIDNLKPDRVTLDCPSTNIRAYVSYLKSFLKNKNVEIKAEHKAERYPEVAAASILAKTSGDAELRKIQSGFSEDIGSGYPADPSTKKFLEKNYKKHPEIFRRTWESYKRLKPVSEKQKPLSEF
jgi:ribonuclease HII